MLEELMEHAADCSDLFDFRVTMLRHLQKTIAFDSAIYVQGPNERPASINKGPFLAMHPKVLREPRFTPDLIRLRAAVAGERVIIDTEAFSASARSRSAFFNEVLRPQGIRSQLVSTLEFRGRSLGALYLCRHDRSRFGERERNRLLRLRPALSVADAVVASTSQQANSPLTHREEEVTRLVCRGMPNREIAGLLGTSPHTVRNQLAEIFEKLGVANRAELAAWATAHGLFT